MFFTLEIMQAFHGDCLLLHFGTNTDPKTMVIDGGPAGVYSGFLRKRLIEIKNSISPTQPLPLSMVMVSHLDDDHINGVLELTNEIRNDNTKFKIENLWVNTFDDIIGNIQLPVISGIAAGASVASVEQLLQGLPTMEEDLTAVIASTGQGRKIRDVADTLNIPVNNPFKPIKPGKAVLVRGDVKQGERDWEAGLKISVIHPDEKRLLKLQKKWDADLKEARKKGDNSIIFASISSPDNSPFNLSSIVCLLRFEDKTMLLTGDGRADDILHGLKVNKLLGANGKIHVNVLKMQHHGSARNLSPEFFKVITADHYVFSANGEHKNPDKETLALLAEATKGNDNFTVHFTNDSGKDKKDPSFELKDVMDDFIRTQNNNGRTFKINIRQSTTPSIVLNLLDDIDF